MPACAMASWAARSPMSNTRVAEILTSIADGRGEAPSLPERLCEACLAALAISGVGLALMTPEGPGGVVAATDGPARKMEDLQFSLGEGPCVDASASGRPVLQPDLLDTAVARWPAFGAAVLSAGIRAIFAFPLQVGAIRLGILDLYRDTPGRLTSVELIDALAFADAATLVLLHLQDESSIEGEPPMPIEVLNNRAEIHQATGMISVQLGVSLATALLRLRATGYAQDRSVTDVAADVVSRRIRFDDSDAGISTDP